MAAFWSTKYEQVAASPRSTGHGLPVINNPGNEFQHGHSAPSGYSQKSFLVERHTCTDIPCALLFAVCLAFTGHIMNYAFTNGDPRKVYHGMDWQGNLCGVDLPWKPYVFWCATDRSALKTAIDWKPVVSIDFHHPICVEFCPNSPATQNACYDGNGNTTMVSDYSTHAVGKHYCVPQAGVMLDKVNEKLASHPTAKYLPLVVSTFREGWLCLLGAVGLAVMLSFMYILALECFAGMVMWFCLITLVIFPGAIGASLIHLSYGGGIDGMPGSGDSQTDFNLGIGCCIGSCLFLFVCCCMAKAVNKAIKSVESAAACMFHAKSLLLEPILNLIARLSIWTVGLLGFAWLVSVGDVRKSKMYRTFTYTTEEHIYLVFYTIMMLWLNDLCNAMSQYVIATAAARWYFTEHIGGTKLVPECLLCKGYVIGLTFHFGSLAFGSLIIALTRPVRMVILVLLYAGQVTDNAACGCLSKVCACCYGCFESLLMHLSKTAYIDMAITSGSFCASGRNAVHLLATENKAIAALAGATWVFTIAGLASVTTFGAFITSFIVQNTEAFTSPSSRYYIQDPMVMACCAGVLSFLVALCFMLVFDAVADTMLVCLAYDMKDQREHPVAIAKAAPPPPQQSVFASFFNPQPAAPVPNQATAVKRPQYMHFQMQELLNHA